MRQKAKNVLQRQFAAYLLRQESCDKDIFMARAAEFWKACDKGSFGLPLPKVKLESSNDPASLRLMSCHGWPHQQSCCL